MLPYIAYIRILWDLKSCIFISIYPIHTSFNHAIKDHHEHPLNSLQKPTNNPMNIPLNPYKTPNEILRKSHPIKTQPTSRRLVRQHRVPPNFSPGVSGCPSSQRHHGGSQSSSGHGTTQSLFVSMVTTGDFGDHVKTSPQILPRRFLLGPPCLIGPPGP